MEHKYPQPQQSSLLNTKNTSLRRSKLKIPKNSLPMQLSKLFNPFYLATPHGRAEKLVLRSLKLIIGERMRVKKIL